MARKKKHVDIAAMQPTELGELKKVAEEFINRMQNIENEIKLLGEDKKALIEEFEEKLDVKTLALAMKVLKIESAVDRKSTYDAFVEILKNNQET